MLALQYRWSNHLTVRMDDANDRGTSLDEAKQQLIIEQPALHAVLVAGARRTEWLRNEQHREEQTIDIQSHAREILADYAGVRA